MTIDNIINHLKDNLAQTDIRLFAAAGNNLISSFEQGLSLKLPDDVKQFYKFANGFASAEDQFRIIPLEEIIDQTRRHLPNVISIAEYMVYCDVWHIEVNAANYNDYHIFNIGRHSETVVLSHSFAEFLHRFLQGGVFETGGLYDWYDEVRENIDTEPKGL
ncbi:SMI1/KNR4 family protein [Mucilaginibacter lacusdianchii]|uniref:SMI1/KNR4 family protein n=1 Tax=Mucilaginibacter lacusdianchii TaxID=2684211 RepID=UPI00131D7977|nr:SMI1/KNR4 family protein [Mucilaginibacter sp. JXJ CY 39]